MFTLTKFEVDYSFDNWTVKVGGVIKVNGIKTRVYDYYKVSDFRKKIIDQDPLELNARTVEEHASKYYLTKLGVL